MSGKALLMTAGVALAVVIAHDKAKAGGLQLKTTR